MDFLNNYIVKGELYAEKIKSERRKKQTRGRC